MNIRATPVTLLLAHEHVNTDNLSPAQTYVCHVAKWMPATNGWEDLLTLISNSSANTNFLWNRHRVYEQKLIETRCCRQEGIKKITTKKSPPPPQKQTKCWKTHDNCNPHQVKPVFTTLPCANTQTGKSRLKRFANRTETKVCLVCEPWHNNHKGQLGVGVSFSMHRTKHFAWLVILWVSQQQGLHSEQIKPDFLQVSYLCGCSNKMHIFMTSFTYHFSESLCLASLLVMQSTMRSHATR